MTEVWTIRKVLAWSTHFLKQKGSPSARLDAEILISAALTCSRIELYTGIEKPLDEHEKSAVRERIRRRGQGEPVAYILGKKGFWKHEFQVTRDVLIPRPDTELLVEVSLAEFAKRDLSHGAIVDVGAGSGCVGISLAAELPSAQVQGWDVSEKCVALARENAAAIGVSNYRAVARNGLLQASWKGKYEAIVSNPPYVAMYEEERLPVSVKNYEPPLALFANDDGLEFYRAFAEICAAHLQPQGFLAVEVGATQAASVVEIFEGYGWHVLAPFRDLADLERVVVALPKEYS